MDIINTRVINGAIQVNNTYLTSGRPHTYLNGSSDSASGTITVFATNSFVAGNFYVLIGDFGNGNAEIVKIHASTEPVASTGVITLAANTVNNHDSNESVWFLGFNRWEFSRATTATGDKTVLSIQDVDATKRNSIYLDTNTTGSAFLRANNEDGATFSGYSAGSPYANPAFNTVEFMIHEAMREVKQIDDSGNPLFTKEFTPDDGIKFANEALRDIRRFRNKLSWTQSYNSIIGQTSRGSFQFTPPTDSYDIYSFRAIEELRLNNQRFANRVGPDVFFNQVMNDVDFTQVRTAASAGDTTLEIDNSYDFDDDGSVLVLGQTITYTGVTRSDTVGILTGVPASGTGAITASISVDDWVFQNATESEPNSWTLYNGLIYIYPLPDATWINKNVYEDYFKAITEVDSLDDVIDYIQFDPIKKYLKFKIRAIVKNDGVEDLSDPDLLQYKDQVTTLIKKDRSLNRKSFRSGYESRDEREVNPLRRREGDFRGL